MKVTREDGSVNLHNVKKIIWNRGPHIIVDGEYYSGPLIIESETIVGFMALEELTKAFDHMKCVKDNNFEDCIRCPVKESESGPCGIMGIKEAAEKERLGGNNAN